MNQTDAVSQLLKHFQTTVFHIAFAGLGAVGGVYAAALMDGLRGDPRVRVSFLVTERHLAALRQVGLMLVTREGSTRYRPDHIVSRGEDLSEPVQLLIMAVKGNQLARATAQWQDVLGEKSWVLSLLNGVHNGRFLQDRLPSRRILDGCVYVGTHLEAPGRVFWEGGPRRLQFGDICGQTDHLQSLADLFCQGGIEAQVVHPIAEAIWEKFSFVSPVAVVTALFKCTLADIGRDQEKRTLFLDLTHEILTLGRADGQLLDGLSPERSAAKLALFDELTTSSLYRDLSQGHSGEFDTLVDEVLRMARVHKLTLSTYERSARKLHSMYDRV